MEICERAVELEIQMRSHRNIFEFTTDVLRIPCARVIAASPRCSSRRVCANFEAGIGPPPFHFLFFSKMYYKYRMRVRTMKKITRCATSERRRESFGETTRALPRDEKPRDRFRQVTNVAERSRTGGKSEERKRRGTRAVRVESASENACRIGARERGEPRVSHARSTSYNRV